MSLWRFEFKLDTPRKLEYVRIPSRMTKEVQELWVKRGVTDGVLRLHRGTENKQYPTRFRHVFTGPGKFKTYLGEGWGEFVSSNSIQMEDRIQLLLEDDDLMLYQVRIWRADKEITIVDPHVLIENDGSISDVDSMEYVPSEILFKIPTFEFTFSKGYFDKPGINIPVVFARAHFHGLKDGTPVEMYVNKWWKGVMRIKFDTNNKILTCTVKKRSTINDGG
ncbi:uncharacterized protein LOC110689077 [Chenopodium quinoa]|uniref:uncharacterized protein LOC110689077 n=1 Tax=Chenopodium quinoa TaxID=63459 RepID=UPI000B7952A7|nr:uncharacterized protein LOC110689077 [Chenopodium quinoa]